ncbi:MAG: valine--tRNA ligase, partial [Candidatus Zambryskibacteria bacterium CG10_big_fil_rev_8_21_14_0_10_34_34]
MILDKNGKKMSKSNPETAVDPLLTIEKYGADALRMAMIVGVGPGSNNSLSEDKIKAYKHFANKIWNITRFVLENSPRGGLEKNSLRPPLRNFGEENNAHLEKFDSLIKEVTDDMENYRFYLAAEKLYHYTWHTFADIIVEESKTKIKEGGKESESTKNMLGFLLKEQLKLLHPFMPF